MGGSRPKVQRFVEGNANREGQGRHGPIRSAGAGRGDHGWVMSEMAADSEFFALGARPGAEGGPRPSVRGPAAGSDRAVFAIGG